MHIHSDSLHGFIATTALLMLAVSSLAFIVLAGLTVSEYADNVMLHEMRIQHSLNEITCADIRELRIEKDATIEGLISIPEFECTIAVP